MTTKEPVDRRVGLVHPTAREQIVRAFPTAPIQALPKGTPGRVTASEVGITDTGAVVTFGVIGDHGGVKDPSPQYAVARALHDEAEVMAFLYSVGDVVYYNGDGSEYVPQFLEPYAPLALPILAIPGNHDGDTTDDATREPLDTFMANFCTSSPQPPPHDRELEFGRHTQTQPYCDWTLELEAVTIIGLYSNVPSGGHLDQSQIDWLAGELEAADAAKRLFVALHHPPFSVDAHHGGSERIGKALDSAFDAAKRTPDVVLSGHVHDYQRFTRTYGDRQITYVVIGNSGYHNLHKLAAGANPGEMFTDGVVFNFGDASEYGYLKFTVGDGIKGEYVGVTPNTAPNLTPLVTSRKDVFSIS